jgi:hypothetical protein
MAFASIFLISFFALWFKASGMQSSDISDKQVTVPPTQEKKDTK